MSSFSSDEIRGILQLAKHVKSRPQDFQDEFHNKTLLMLFQKPSLRTRVSFETGMTQMGGHAIFYSVADSPLGEKETMYDTANCLSRHVDIIMARLNKREDLNELAKHARIPVINGLDDWGHPCQILADFQTIEEKFGSLKGRKMAYIGDINNNVTFDLARGGCLTGMQVNLCGPPQLFEEPDVISMLAECEELSKAGGGSVKIYTNAKDAATDADVIYADTFMSYHLPKDSLEERLNMLAPYKITTDLMNVTGSDSVFMHCLPAQRGYEVDGDVIDGERSVIFDQAENRLHAQKALLLCLKKMNDLS